jgi:hypothetical protein
MHKGMKKIRVQGKKPPSVKKKVRRLPNPKISDLLFVEKGLIGKMIDTLEKELQQNGSRRNKSD